MSAMRATEAVELLQGMFQVGLSPIPIPFSHTPRELVLIYRCPDGGVCSLVKQNWDHDSLIVMLQTNHGHVEHTIETILKMESDSVVYMGNGSIHSSKIRATSATGAGPNTSNGSSEDEEGGGGVGGGALDVALARQVSLDGNDDYAVTLSLPDDSVGPNGEVPEDAIMQAFEATEYCDDGECGVSIGSRRGSTSSRSAVTANALCCGVSSSDLLKSSIREDSWRGAKIHLPDEYLRPYFLRARGFCGGVKLSEVAAGRSVSSGAGDADIYGGSGEAGGGNVDAYTMSDAQLAELMQNELFKQQLRENRAFSGLFAGLGNVGLHSSMRSPVVSGDDAPQLNPGSHTEPAVFRAYGGVARPDIPSSSAVTPQSFFLESSGWTSYLANMGGEARRKMNEMAVKFQAATGGSGVCYVSVHDNEGTSCAIDKHVSEENAKLQRSKTLNRRGANICRGGGGGGGGGGCSNSGGGGSGDGGCGASSYVISLSSDGRAQSTRNAAPQVNAEGAKSAAAAAVISGTFECRRKME